MPRGIITFLFRFSQRVQPIDCYNLNNTDLFWQTLLLGISFNIVAFLIDSEEFVFEQCVRLFCNPCLQADKLRATKFSRLSFISCTYEIIAFFAECSLRYFSKIGGKTSAFERPINVSNEKRSELRFCSKSILIVISCV